MEHSVPSIFIAEITKGIHDKALDNLEQAVKARRRAISRAIISGAIEPGDIVKFVNTISPKYLVGQLARVLNWRQKNMTLEMLDKNIGGRFGGGMPFGCPPSMVTLHKKGDGVVLRDFDSGEENEGDDDDDSPGSPGELTMRDFKVGMPAKTAAGVRPSYIANQRGIIKELRRTRILFVFDNPPIGTRFERGVVIRPRNLVKV